jgi:predicted metalloprotease with PDZ domain
MSLRASTGKHVHLGYLLAAALLATGAVSSASGEPPAETIEVDGGRIRLTMADADLAAARDRLRRWTARSAEAVVQYYGRFPVDEAQVVVESGSDSGVGHGVTFRENGIINVTVGSATTDEELRDDWVLVHEMIHLALPNLRRRHIWLSEGISTYVESVARVQAGHRPAEDVWLEFVRAMPQGLPRAGDQGLDHTHTWGRTYWGGALFCLQADIAIRERTGGRRGLQDALAAVAEASRGDLSLWSIDAVLRVADAATGVDALMELYAEAKDKPVAPDLDALWASLGVVRQGSTVRLDDDAPQAAIRRAIMAPAVYTTLHTSDRPETSRAHSPSRVRPSRRRFP